MSLDQFLETNKSNQHKMKMTSDIFILQGYACSSCCQVLPHLVGFSVLSQGQCEVN